MVAGSLALLLAGCLAAPAQDPPSVKDLARQISREGDGVDSRIFDTLASIGDEASLKALERSLLKLRRGPAVEAAYRAFRLYRGVAVLDLRAFGIVAESAATQRTPNHARAATRALIEWGDRATTALEDVVGRGRESGARRLACNSLVPFLAARDQVGAIELILAHASLSPEADASRQRSRSRWSRPGSTAVVYVGLNTAQRDAVAGRTHREVVRMSLSGCADPKVQRALLDHMTDEDTTAAWRVLLLEVLAGREGIEVTRALLELLEHSDAAVRLGAAQAIAAREPLPSAERALRRLLRADEDALRREAVVALGRLLLQEPEWHEELLRLARDRSPAVRMGAAVALEHLRTPEAVEALLVLLTDEVWSVRSEALARVGALRRKQAIPHLIRRLGAESGRLRHEAAAVLRLLTGLDYGHLPTRWKMWWESEGLAFELPSYEEALEAEQRRDRVSGEGRTGATFYGLRVLSDRVAFVLDTSGSMRDPAASRGGRTRSPGSSGPTKIDVAKEELSRALTDFPDGDLFNVVFFADTASAWEDRLVKMAKRARGDALEFVADRRADGGTALHEALRCAFDDPLIDTIYLLSDGDPTVGELIDPARIRAEVALWNRARRVRINGIAVGQHSVLLRWLAADSGGRYLRADS